MEKETMVATVPQTEIVDEQQLSRDVTDIWLSRPMRITPLPVSSARC